MKWPLCWRSTLERETARSREIAAELENLERDRVTDQAAAGVRLGLARCKHLEVIARVQDRCAELSGDLAEAKELLRTRSGQVLELVGDAPSQEEETTEAMGHLLVPPAYGPTRGETAPARLARCAGCGAFFAHVVGRSLLKPWGWTCSPACDGYAHDAWSAERAQRAAELEAANRRAARTEVDLSGGVEPNEFLARDCPVCCRRFGARVQAGSTFRVEHHSDRHVLEAGSLERSWTVVNEPQPPEVRP